MEGGLPKKYVSKKPQIQGDKSRKCEAYLIYDNYLSDAGNEVGEFF